MSLLERSLAVLGAVIIGAIAVDASVAIKRNFSELAQLSDVVFEGTVASIQYKRVEGGWIRTLVTFADLAVIKGRIEEVTYTLQFSGGIIDQDDQRVDGVPQFEVGQREIVFSKDNGRVMSPIVGVWQGRFKIKSDNNLDLVFNHEDRLLTGVEENELSVSPNRFLPGFFAYNTLAEIKAQTSIGMSKRDFILAIQDQLSK